MESLASEEKGQTTSELAREITDSVQAQMPAEKAKAEQELLRTAQELRAKGSDWADGRGQAIGSIPPRMYMRWAQMLPGCWQDKQFVEEFLFDNPQCRAPGYRPPQHSLRHSFTSPAARYHLLKDRVA